MTPVQTRIDKARWWSLNEQTFYATCASNLPDVMDDTAKTSATDGVAIYWNPSYVEGLSSEEEVRYVLLHETLHNALQHLWRLPLTELGNRAADYEIACILADIPDIKAPPGILYDPKYKNMAGEEILIMLTAEQQKKEEQQKKDQQGQQGSQGQSGSQPDQGSQSGSQPGKSGQQGQQGSQPGNQPGQSGSQPGKPGHEHGCPCGGIRAPKINPTKPESAQAQSEELRKIWESRVMQAAQVAQASGIGDIPGSMQRVLERIRHTSVDWKAETTAFVKDAGAGRNDWSRSSRRHAWQKVIYPRKRVDELGTVIFVRDTSGSVDDRVLSQYAALITDCIAETECHAIVIDADRDIQDEIHLEPGDTCPLHAKGGGGTDFRPAFARADELVEEGEHIAGLVYLTDLQCYRFPEESDIPTLWLATKDGKAPFGRTVRIEG